MKKDNKWEKGLDDENSLKHDFFFNLCSMVTYKTAQIVFSLHSTTITSIATQYKCKRVKLFK